MHCNGPTPCQPCPTVSTEEMLLQEEKLSRRSWNRLRVWGEVVVAGVVVVVAGVVVRTFMGLVWWVSAPRRTLALTWRWCQAMVVLLTSSGGSLLTSGCFSGVLIFQTTTGEGGQEVEVPGWRYILLAT